MSTQRLRLSGHTKFIHEKCYNWFVIKLLCCTTHLTISDCFSFYCAHLTSLDRTLLSKFCPSVSPSVKRVYCDKTKAPSEKSSIMTNRKSPTSCPMSRRWTAYVAPKLPSSVTVHFICQMAHALRTCGRTQTPQLHACFHTMAVLDAHSLSTVADQLVFSLYIKANTITENGRVSHVAGLPFFGASKTFL